jgi:microcystin-dependent protein
MGTPFIGELKLVPFNFAPKGWAMCNGQFLPINQNQALFSLLGTMYGGNGQTTFALPDLRGRTPISFGNGHTQGEAAGEVAHTVTLSEMPQHIHMARAVGGDGTTPIPTGAALASFNNGYRQPTELTTLHPATVSNIGGSQPHENRQPFSVLNWCIALQGAFPSQN